MLSIKDKRKVRKQLTRHPSRTIRRFFREFDLDSQYLFGDAVIEVINAAVMPDMRVVLTCYSNDISSPIIAANGGQAVFVNIFPHELTRLQ